MRFSKGTKISILTVGAALLFVMLKFYYEFSLLVCILVTAVMEIFIGLSFFFEARSDKNNEKLRRKIESGDHYSSDEWKEKYADFIREKGFERIKRKSMASDLSARYRRPFGVFMLLMGAAVAICGVVLIPVDLGAGIVILLTGIGFVLYGIYGLSSVNVRKFISSCGVILDDINDSYMNGKLLTYKKAYSDEYRNCGINIGGKYTVIFTVKEIAALKNFDISDVQHRILRTKYYGNDIYTGARYTHHIDITVRNSDTGNNKTFTVELSEFQAELAAEELRAKLITDNRDKNYNI